jgi:hypothetical protein
MLSDRVKFTAHFPKCYLQKAKAERVRMMGMEWRYIAVRTRTKDKEVFFIPMKDASAFYMFDTLLW